MRTIALLLSAVLFTPLAWSTKPLPGWKALGSSEIDATFRRKSLGDGFHYDYQFHANGALTGAEMTKDVRGRWTADGARLCLHRERPRKLDECFEVHQRGREINLLSGGQLLFRGELAQIEPSKHTRKRQATPP